MRTWGVAALVWGSAVSLGAPAPDRSAAAPPGAYDRLAVASLVHSARSLGQLRDDSAPARVGRMSVLLRRAERLAPDDPRCNRQLIDIYEGLGDVSRAARAGRRYLLARPEDHAVGVRWIRLSQANLNSAEQRAELLNGVLSEKRLAESIRAAAGAELCGVRLRQSDKTGARQACEQALRLDAYEPRSLAAMRQITGRAAPADLLADALAVFRGNPRSTQSAWAVAWQLQQAGLHAEALAYYDHAHAISAAKPPAGDVMASFLVDYLNAMLDAGQAGKAVGRFEPLMPAYGGSLLLRALMAEACRALKDDARAAAHVAAMEGIYKPLTAPGAKRSGEQSAELAWFYLAFKPEPKTALKWAREAAGSAGKDPFVQRVLGAAELAAGESQAGLKRLAPLVDKDPHAAVAVARHHLSKGDAAAAANALARGAGNVRSGMGWRELARLAADNKVALPPLAGADALRALAKAQPAHVIEMGRHPERFVALRLTAAADEFVCGQAVEITAELENVSAHPVPLGQWGLFDPVLYLSLNVEGQGGKQFPDLTLLVLPAPRYLQPAAKVRHTVRVDVGPVEEILAGRPLADMKLSVSAVLDPLLAGEKLFSSVPEVKVLPVTVRRRPLFDLSGGPQAARHALGYIVRDLKRGEPEVRLLAARQTASLLAHVRGVETGRAKAVFAEVLTKPVLLSMTRAFLQADPPAVRAEMLAALQRVRLDERIIALTGRCVADRSSLVRLRLIELLAGRRTEGRETLLDLYAGDQDEFVREMASILREGK